VRYIRRFLVFLFMQLILKPLSRLGSPQPPPPLSLFQQTSSPGGDLYSLPFQTFLSSGISTYLYLSILDDISLSHFRFNMLPIHYFRFHLGVSYINKRKAVIYCDVCYYIFYCPYYIFLSWFFCSSFSSIIYTFFLPYLCDFASRSTSTNSDFYISYNIFVYLIVYIINSVFSM